MAFGEWHVMAILILWGLEECEFCWGGVQYTHVDSCVSAFFSQTKKIILVSYLNSCQCTIKNCDIFLFN